MVESRSIYVFFSCNWSTMSSWFIRCLSDAFAATWAASPNSGEYAAGVVSHNFRHRKLFTEMSKYGRHVILSGWHQSIHHVIQRCGFGGHRHYGVDKCQTWHRTAMVLLFSAKSMTGILFSEMLAGCGSENIAEER